MFFPEFYLNPEAVEQALDKITDLLIEFTKVQTRLIGPALVKPGHGFASSRFFDGFGMSDDNIVMLPPDLYNDFAVPRMVVPAGLLEVGVPLLRQLVRQKKTLSV